MVIQIPSTLANAVDTKRKVEELSEELKTLDTRLWNERDPNPATQHPEGVEPAHPLHEEQEADGMGASSH